MSEKFSQMKATKNKKFKTLLFNFSQVSRLKLRVMKRWLYGKLSPQVIKRHLSPTKVVYTL